MEIDAPKYTGSNISHICYDEKKVSSHNQTMQKLIPKSMQSVDDTLNILDTQEQAITHNSTKSRSNKTSEIKSYLTKRTIHTQLTTKKTLTTSKYHTKANGNESQQLTIGTP